MFGSFKDIHFTIITKDTNNIKSKNCNLFDYYNFLPGTLTFSNLKQYAHLEYWYKS